MKSPSTTIYTIISNITCLLLATIILTACASSRSGQVYSRDQARETQEVRLGVVIDVREVLIEGTKSSIGAGAGAMVGSIAGGSRGDGRGSAIGSVLGAVAGGVAGAAIEEGVTRKKGLEITVTLDNGRSISVVQEADEPFSVNDRVRVLTDRRGTTRVTHIGR